MTTDTLHRRRFLENGMRAGLTLAAAPALVTHLASCRPRQTADVGGITTPSRLQRTIDRRFPRARLAHLPTPLEKLEVLTAESPGSPSPGPQSPGLRAPGPRSPGPRWFIKRDDQTGLAFGGNKTRKLEFILQDALDQGADTILTSAGLQSNWARQTVAAANMFGLKTVLVLSKPRPGPVDYDGNLFLDALMGADIRFVEPDQSRQAVLDQTAEELKAHGRRPYVVSVGGSRPGGSMAQPLGAMGYTLAFVELYQQAQEQNTRIDSIVIANGSGGTQAGLVVGARAAAPHVRIVGINVSGAREPARNNIASIAQAAAHGLDLDMTITPEEIIVFDDYVGEGYGVMSPEIARAITLLARKEAILLDPVYTGKALAGLLDLNEREYFREDENVVFIHTGGTPALFPYRQEILELAETA